MTARGGGSRYVIRRPTSVGILSRGKDYSIKDLGASPAGYTDLLKKELGVSLAAEAPQTRWTHLHELSHVRHSLWTAPRVADRAKRLTGRTLSHMAILAAEDARINELLVRRVPDAHKGFKLAMRKDHLRRDLEGYVSCHASPRALADAIRPACDPAHVAAVDAFLAKLAAMPDRELSVLRVTVPLAALIDDLKTGRMPDAEPGEGAKGEGSGDGADGPARPVPPKENGSAPGESEAGEGEDGDGDEDGDDGDPHPDDPGDEHAHEAAGADGDEPAGDEPEAGEGGEGGEAPADEDEAPGADGADTDGDEDVDADEGEPGDGDGPEGEGEGDEDSAKAADGAAEDAEAFGEPDAHTAEAPRCTGALPADGGGTERAHPWIVPTVVEPPLTVPMRGGNFQVTSAETGTAVRWGQLYRMQTDGVVFRRARRRPGALQRGTVLVDVSSSMNFTDASLDAIVAMLPHATVAVYSGSYREAWLVVVAKNGRRVASMGYGAGLVPRSGGNTCDGPALLWLSRQPAPRLWVCDGYVTGTTDVAEDWQAAECAAILTAAGIVQVGGAGEGSLQATRELTEAPIWPETQANLPAALAPVLKAIERGQV